MTGSGHREWFRKGCVAAAFRKKTKVCLDRVQAKIIKADDSFSVRWLTLNQLKVTYAKGVSSLGSVKDSNRTTSLLVVRVVQIKDLQV